MRGAFYGVIDVVGFRRWAFPLAVVGMNSIAIYMMAQLMKPFVASTVRIHLGPIWKAVATSESVDRFMQANYHTSLPPVLFDGLYGPIVQSAMVLGVFWLICLWLYRRGIFVKI